MKKYSKKNILFEKYSKNFELVSTEMGLNITFDNPKYVCPLCKLIFKHDLRCILDKRKELTIEHVPPSSLGGKPILLICNSCNNNTGRILDSQLYLRIKNNNVGAVQGDEIVTRFLINNKIETGGKIYFDKDLKPNFIFHSNVPNPKFHDELIDIVTGKEPINNMSFNLKESNKEKECLALIKSAYLMIFQKFGHVVLFCRNLDEIRKLVNQEKELTNEYKSIFVDIPDTFLGVKIIKSPKELVGYYVGMKIKFRGVDRNFGVIIPGESSASINFYSKLEKLMDDKTSLSFVINEISEKDYILSKEYCMSGYKNWN